MKILFNALLYNTLTASFEQYFNYNDRKFQKENPSGFGNISV